MLLQPEHVGESLYRWAQPRIEPEIAFVTARTVDRVLSREEVAPSVARVTVAAEIIDSRCTDCWFRLPDVVRPTPALPVSSSATPSRCSRSVT
jgi:2-oxo-3-hexenedioate decarboxylase